MPDLRTCFSPCFLCSKTLAALLVLGTCVSASAGERWTSLHSNRTVEADFVGLWGDQVVLQMADRRVAVKIDDLVAESRILARKMAEEQNRSRSAMVSQIQDDAKEAAAPAPTPIPKPDSAPRYQPLNSGELLESIEWYNLQSENGHSLLASFDALPPSYQGEVERLVRMALSKVDLNALNQAIGSVHSIGDLIVTRQRWVFSYPRFQAIPEDSREPIERLLLTFAGLLRDGLDPNELKLDDINQRPFRAWLLDLDARVAPYMSDLTEQLQSLGMPQQSYNVLEEGNGRATVEVSAGEETIPMTFVQVEGQWVPEPWNSEAFNAGVKEFEESLQGQEAGSVLAGGQAAMVSMAVTQFVGPLKEAPTSRELHAKMDGIFTSMAPMLAMAGQFAQSQMGRRPNGNMGYGGYDDGYGMEEEMMGMDEMEDYEAEMMESMNSGRP